MPHSLFTRRFALLSNTAITAIMAMVTGCSQEKEPEPGPALQPAALVRVEPIVRKSIAPEFRALGNVRPRHMSIVASGADGIVAEFPIDVGDFVSEEALLSQLRMEATQRDIEEQEAVLKEREAELKEISNPRQEDKDEAQARKASADVACSNAERRLQELRALSERGAANQSEVKDAQEERDAAEQTRLAAIAMLSKISHPRLETVLQAEARLEAQQKHVEFLKAERDKRSTKAPFAGFIVEEHTNVGQWLSKGAPVVTLAQLDEVEVEVQVDQQYIDQISPGRTVTMQIQGTGSHNGLVRKEGINWIGVVDSVVPRSNWQNGSRSFPVIVRITNEIETTTMPPIPAIREGMMAEATFQGELIEAILVPKDSLVRTTRGTFVFVINPASEGQPLSVRQVMVTPGLSTGGAIQVTGESLEPGQQVVTEGAEGLRAFHTVEIMKEEGTGTSE